MIQPIESIGIDARVGLENKRGTVKFAGHLTEINDGNELWLGIDWDRPDHGKHNGTLKGKQYFQARHPTSGSFVKAKQVNVGQDFMKTLRDHYYALHNDMGDTDVGVTFVLKAFSYEKMFIMPSINLADHFISFLNPNTNDMFERCSSLFLSNNLLHEWDKLLRILSLFPILNTLDISLNVMQSIKPNVIVPQRQVKELLMNSCRLDHDTLLALSSYFPCLETLRIMGNELSTLPDLSAFLCLKHLFVGNNPIGDFTKLWHLAPLNGLETLSLHGCGIKSVRLPERSFDNLQVLNLNENSLNDWESINELRKLPRLKNLRTSGLYAGERGCQSYEILVAKLPHLEVLDSCVISAKERRECEVFFLNRFYRDPLPEIHLSDLERLAKIYNEELQINMNSQVSSNSCTFALKFDNQTIERSLLLNLTVRKLVTLASRIFDFEAEDVKVSIQVFEDNYELLEWDSSTVLRAFDPQNGCIVKFVRC